MRSSHSPLAVIALFLTLASLVFFGTVIFHDISFWPVPVALLTGATVALKGGKSVASLIALLVLVHIAALGLILMLPQVNAPTSAGAGFWCMVVAAWLLAWCAVQRLSMLKTDSRAARRIINLSIPLLFGLWLLLLWEIVVRGFGIPTILLPPPSMIGARIASSGSILWADFQQTFLKAVVAGYVIGCGTGLIAAIIVDRIPFLRKGLLPVGNLVAALPVVGIAPIMVMWFGSYWQSKAAVVVIMTFFPMLVNTVAGLASSGSMERDLMRTYGSNYWQTLFKLRLPAAMPFIFNALKINSTLALIGAIVAEFFGSPIVGMGFRISAEVGRMNVDMVWAEIFVAALAGSLSYGLITLVERAVTFWHPSYRT
ncbi:MAG: ABC transporter permease [Phyllobacterium sp.]